MVQRVRAASVDGVDDRTIDISVVVPTRNRAALVEPLLRQLLRIDDGLDYQIIVVDEGSTDRTPELLAQLVTDHGITVVRHDDPCGVSGARNAGREVSTGRYIAWIDDDDLTSPDRLRRQFEALESSEHRWSCAARVDIDDQLDVIGHMRCPAPERLMERLLAFNVLPTAAQGLLVERGLVDEVGGYDTSLESAEDWEYCIRLLSRSQPHLIDEPLVGYRTGAASMSTNTPRMERSIAAVLDKHRELLREYGVEPDWASIHHSLLAADLLGSRGAAFRRSIKIFLARPTFKSAARCVVIPLVPGHFARSSAERRRAQVPQSWIDAAGRWLSSVQLVDE